MLSLTYHYSVTDTDQHETFNRLSKHCLNNDLVFVDICIDQEEELVKKYSGLTPVVNVGPYTLKGLFSDKDLLIATRSALERHTRLTEEHDQAFQQRLKNGLSITKLDRFSYYFSRYYSLAISVVILVFVGIPFLAPVLQKNGQTGAANVIYKIYHVICHQLDFRSFFLFGEQPFYPRELAGIKNMMSYEQATGLNVIDLDHSRNFIGNEIMGYKVAICERDIAIYGSMALFGILYHLQKKKIKQLPWYFWVVLALLPIAIDGISQIPSLSSGWPEWVPIRESTPFLRLLTGILFGVGTAWYMYPMMEESMKETRASLFRKFAIVEKLKKKMESNDSKRS